MLLAAGMARREQRGGVHQLHTMKTIRSLLFAATGLLLGTGLATASGTLTPIGFGVLSEAQLLERIALVAAGPPQAPASPAGRPLHPGPPAGQGATALLAMP